VCTTRFSKALYTTFLFEYVDHMHTKVSHKFKTVLYLFCVNMRSSLLQVATTQKNEYFTYIMAEA
jgi:hypothetical protein